MWPADRPQCSVNFNRRQHGTLGWACPTGFMTRQLQQGSQTLIRDNVVHVSPGVGDYDHDGQAGDDHRAIKGGRTLCWVAMGPPLASRTDCPLRRRISQRDARASAALGNEAPRVERESTQQRQGGVCSGKKNEPKAEGTADKTSAVLGRLRGVRLVIRDSRKEDYVRASRDQPLFPVFTIESPSHRRNRVGHRAAQQPGKWWQSPPPGERPQSRGEGAHSSSGKAVCVHAKKWPKGRRPRRPGWSPLLIRPGARMAPRSGGHGRRKKDKPEGKSRRDGAGGEAVAEPRCAYGLMRARKCVGSIDPVSNAGWRDWNHMGRVRQPPISERESGQTSRSAKESTLNTCW